MSNREIERYNLYWPSTRSDLAVEIDCTPMGGAGARRTGALRATDGSPLQAAMISSGLDEMAHVGGYGLSLYVQYRIIGQIGPAGSGKTFIPSAYL